MREYYHHTRKKSRKISTVDGNFFLDFLAAYAIVILEGGLIRLTWLDNLRKMKENSRLKTKAISLGSGIPEPTLEKLFAGATKDPKLETMRQLVYFLGYTLDQLVQDSSVEITPSKVLPYTDKEINLLNAYRQATPDDRQIVDLTLKKYMSQTCTTEVSQKAI